MREMATTEFSQGHPEWQSNWKEPATTTNQGYIRWMHITDEMVEQVAELIAEGVPRHQAAQQVGTSNTQLYRLEKRRPDVAERFLKAAREGEASFHDHIRSGLWYHAFVEKNYKALKDLGIMHLPEMEPFRTHRYEVTNVDGEAFKLAAIEALGAEPDKTKLEALLRLLEEPLELEPPAE